VETNTDVAQITSPDCFLSFSFLTNLTLIFKAQIIHAVPFMELIHSRCQIMRTSYQNKIGLARVERKMHNYPRNILSKTNDMENEFQWTIGGDIEIPVIIYNL